MRRGIGCLKFLRRRALLAVSVVALVSNGVGPATAQNGLVGKWSAEGNASDTVGVNPGVLEGNVTFTAGRAGQAFLFNDPLGSATGVRIPHHSSLNVTGPFSVTLWVRANQSQPGSHFAIVDKSHGWVDSTGWSLQGVTASGVIDFNVGLGTANCTNCFVSASSGMNLRDGQWHFIAGVFTGAQVRFYVDGVMTHAVSQSFVPANNSRDLLIGRGYGNYIPGQYRNFQGAVDELQIWNRALSDAEVQGLYQALAGPFAYITNHTGSSVSVMDLSSNRLAATISVGSGPVGVAVNPAATRVYVANAGGWNGDGYNGSTVSVIDTISQSVVHTVPNVGAAPYGVAVNHAGTRVYVTNFGASSAPSTMAVIDTASDSVIARIPLGSHPAVVAVSPDDTLVYAGSYNSHRISVIAAATNSVIREVTEQAPGGLVLDPTGTRLYVGHFYSPACVTIYDAATLTRLGTIPTPAVPWALCMNPEGTRLYTSNTWGGSVSVIDLLSNAVVANINGGYLPHGLALNPTGTKLYVAVAGHNLVRVIDTSTQAIVQDVAAGGYPVALGQFVVAPAVAPRKADTALSISSSANPCAYGQPVNFTATVTSDVGTPTGTVQFKIDGSSFGSPVLLQGGVAASGFVSALAVGDHVIEAVYEGDSRFNGSHSALGGGQTINQALATVTLGNLTQTYTGGALLPAVTTNPPGLAVAWTNAPQTNAGTYAVSATVVDSNYQASVTGSFVINKALATVTLGNLTQTYTGGALLPSVTTNPPGLAVAWTNAPQTEVGNYLVTAVVSDSNYSGSASGTLQILITYEGLGALVRRYVTKEGIVNSLLAKLANAMKAQTRGDANAKAGMIGAFINEVQAQTGKAISPEHAAILIRFAGAL